MVSGKATKVGTHTPFLLYTEGQGRINHAEDFRKPMSTSPDLLARAVAVAADAHAGQQDKNGAPYILHPLRVMLRVEGEEARIVAALHDVVEDSAGRWTLDGLRTAGFPQAVVDAVDAITRRPDEEYADFVVRAARNPLAKQVKLADLQDNMDMTRLAATGDKELARLRRYHRAWLYVTGTLSAAEYAATPE